MKTKLIGVAVVLLVISTSVGFGILYNTEAELDEVQIQLTAKDTQISVLEAEIDSLRGLYPLKTPTYADLQAFLASDNTSKNRYTGEYNCLNFAEDLRANAIAKGIRCGLVLIDLRAECFSHVIVAFVTTDMDLIYIDPSNHDSEYLAADIEVGKMYPEILEDEEVEVSRVTIIW